MSIRSQVALGAAVLTLLALLIGYSIFGQGPAGSNDHKKEENPAALANSRVHPSESNAPAKSAEPPATIPEWEYRISDVLTESKDPRLASQRMLSLYSQLPLEGQVEAAQHISNLTADQDYAPVGALLKNAQTPEPVLNVLMSDVLNRPNKLKLPILAVLARTPNHPMREQARSLLEVYGIEPLDSADGPVQKWLQDHPDNP